MGQRKEKNANCSTDLLSPFCNAALQFCRLFTTKGKKNDSSITFAGFWTVTPKSRGSSRNEHAVEAALDTDAFLPTLCGNVPFTLQWQPS